jgi:hypothetical protein
MQHASIRAGKAKPADFSIAYYPICPRCESNDVKFGESTSAASKKVAKTAVEGAARGRRTIVGVALLALVVAAIMLLSWIK